MAAKKLKKLSPENIPLLKSLIRSHCSMTWKGKAALVTKSI